MLLAPQWRLVCSHKSWIWWPEPANVLGDSQNTHTVCSRSHPQHTARRTCTHAANYRYACVFLSGFFSWRAGNLNGIDHACCTWGSLKGWLKCTAISWGKSQFFNGFAIAEVRETQRTKSRLMRHPVNGKYIKVHYRTKSVNVFYIFWLHKAVKTLDCCFFNL